MVNEQNSTNNEDHLIIYHPHALNPMRRGVDWSLTVIGWLIWAILCRPLILLLLWFLGFEIFYEHMIRLGGIKALAGFSYIYFTTVFAMYLLVRGWNFYNVKKFRRKDRRKNVIDVSTDDLDRYFGFSGLTLAKAQGWKNIMVYFHEKGEILIKETAETESQANKGYFKSS